MVFLEGSAPALPKNFCAMVVEEPNGSVAPCGRQSFNYRRGQAPTLPSPSHCRLNNRQLPLTFAVHHSSVANRQLLFAAVSVRQEPHPPNFPVSLVPCPLSHIPNHNFTCQTLMVSSLLADAKNHPMVRRLMPKQCRCVLNSIHLYALGLSA